jgi:hypothetical protein
MAILNVILDLTDEKLLGLEFIANKDGMTAPEYVQFIMSSACVDYLRCKNDCEFNEIKQKLEIAPEKMSVVKSILEDVAIPVKDLEV